MKSYAPTHLSSLSVDQTLQVAGQMPALNPPLVWYPRALPKAAGTPTLLQTQNVVRGVAALLPQWVLQFSSVLQYIYRPAVVNQASGSTVTVNGQTGTLALQTAVSEAVAVDVVAANPALLNDLAIRLGWQLARVIDAALLAYAFSGGFTTNSPIGSGGSPLTTANLDSIITLLQGAEPMFLVLDPAELSWLTTATDSSSHWTVIVRALAASILGGRPASYKNLRVNCSEGVPTTGSGPYTIQNLAFTPSALAFVSSLQATTNSSTSVQVNSSSPTFTDTAGVDSGLNTNLSALVSCTFSGSGNQTIQAQVLGVPIIINNALGVLVQS